MADSEKSPVEQAQELHEKKKEVVGEAKEQHNQLLEAAKTGEDLQLEETEWVEIGELDIEARTDFTGEVARKIDAIYDANVSPGKVIDTYIDVLTAQTETIKTDFEGGAEITDTGGIQLFWDNWFENHDIEAAGELAFERVVEEPNQLEEKRQEQAVKSFPKNEGRDSDWVRGHGRGGNQGVPPTHADTTSRQRGDRSQGPAERE